MSPGLSMASLCPLAAGGSMQEGWASPSAEVHGVKSCWAHPPAPQCLLPAPSRAGDAVGAAQDSRSHLSEHGPAVLRPPWGAHATLG